MLSKNGFLRNINLFLCYLRRHNKLMNFIKLRGLYPVYFMVISYNDIIVQYLIDPGKRLTEATGKEGKSAPSILGG